MVALVIFPGMLHTDYSTSVPRICAQLYDIGRGRRTIALGFEIWQTYTQLCIIAIQTYHLHYNRPESWLDHGCY